MVDNEIVTIVEQFLTTESLPSDLSPEDRWEILMAIRKVAIVIDQRARQRRLRRGGRYGTT